MGLKRRKYIGHTQKITLFIFNFLKTTGADPGTVLAHGDVAMHSRVQADAQSVGGLYKGEQS